MLKDLRDLLCPKGPAPTTRASQKMHARRLTLAALICLSLFAAAAVAVERQWCDSPVTVHLRGGDLHVQIAAGRASLTGPAERVGPGDTGSASRMVRVFGAVKIALHTISSTKSVVAEVRLAIDPLTATARGAHIAAMFEK